MNRDDKDEEKTDANQSKISKYIIDKSKKFWNESHCVKMWAEYSTFIGLSDTVSLINTKMMLNITGQYDY